MTATPNSGSPDTLTVRALWEARARHDRCENVDIQTGESDGSNLIYCGRCGQLLLSWGGDA